MTALSEDQLALITRVLRRMRTMHMKPTAFNLSLALRANDMPPEDLGQVREWLEQHEQDQPAREEDPRGAKFLSAVTTKPSIAVDQGVDERKKEIPKMATDVATVGPKTWFEFVDESTTGDYVKFQDGDEKVMKIVTNPLFGPIEFKQKDGSVKVNNGLKLTVLVDNNPAIKEWTITSGGLMQQLKAISIREGMGLDIAGAIFRVNVSGDGLQRKYFVKLLQKPGNGAGAAFSDVGQGAFQAQPRPSPEPIPVSDADREAAFQARRGAAQPASQAGSGAEWLEQQRQGMVTAAPIGGR